MYAYVCTYMRMCACESMCLCGLQVTVHAKIHHEHSYIVSKPGSGGVCIYACIHVCIYKYIVYMYTHAHAYTHALRNSYEMHK